MVGILRVFLGNRSMGGNLKAFKRRAGYLLVVGAFLLLCLFIHYRSCVARVERVLSVKVVPVEPSRRDIAPLRVAFAAELFYQTIIDNNLFRPLGWRPPRPIEPYRLIGTKLATDTNAPPQAIIQTTAGEKTYIVLVGDSLDAETEVVLIESKSVTLSTNGQQRTLHLPSGF